MTSSSLNTGPQNAYERQQADIERGAKKLQAIDTLDVDQNLLDKTERAEYQAHLTNLVRDQQRLGTRFMKAGFDPDVRAELPDELASLYNDRAREREEIGSKGILYKTFGRTPGTGGVMPSAMGLMDESISGIEATEFPGSNETAAMLRDIAMKLDPEARDENNPYYVKDEKGRLTLDLYVINKDLDRVRKSIQSLSRSMIPGDPKSAAIMTELRKFEVTLAGMFKLDPVKSASTLEWLTTNAKNPIGFAPQKALKTALLGGVILLGMWALANKNYVYASIMALIAYLILYGKKNGEFDAQRILKNPNLQSNLVALAGKGNKHANAEMVRTLMNRNGEDRKRIDKWIVKGRIPDTELKDIEDPTLRATLEAMPNSEDRIRWVQPFLTLRGKELKDVVTGYIEGITI